MGRRRTVVSRSRAPRQQSKLSRTIKTGRMKRSSTTSQKVAPATSRAAALRGGTNRPSTDDLLDYRDALRTQIEVLVLPSVLARIANGAPVIAPVELARRMLAVAPAPVPVNKMAEQVGPEFYDTNGVATILAGPGNDPVSKQAVEQRRRRHSIVALPTAEGRWVYPTWQFNGSDVLTGLPEVLAAFYRTTAKVDAGRPEAVARPFDEWSIGTWLTTPREDLDGETAVEWLREAGHGPRLDHLLTLARRAAAAWAA